jgi:hypothetical protein
VFGIAWRQFLRRALPLSLLAGIASLLLPPLGLFVILPGGSIWAISRYRQQHAGPLSGGQGARMGALTGFLAFGWFVAALSLNWRVLYQMMVSKLLEAAAQNPDPQFRQSVQWLTTPEAFPALATMFLAIFLVIFLLIGLGSGFLAARLGRNQPRL